MEVKPEWCSIELHSGKAIYSRFTEELKRFVEGKYEGATIVLPDVYVAARGPAGTTVILHQTGLIQGFQKRMFLVLGGVSNVTPLDKSGEWVQALEKVEADPTTVAVAHTPEMPKPDSGLVIAQPGTITP